MRQGDAEGYFHSQFAKLRRFSAEQEMKELTLRYQEYVCLWPYRDCSALAEETLWELDQAQKKLSVKWDNRTKPEQVRLRAVLRWLHRIGIRDIDYATIMPFTWLDISVVLFLWQNPGVQRAYPTLSEELLE